MKAWIYRRKEQLVVLGEEQSSWYVGWRDVLGRRKGKSFGRGEKGRHRAEEYKAQINGELTMTLHPGAHGGRTRVKALSKDEIRSFDGQPVVYFVEAVGLDRVKIGTSNCISKRIRTIQACCPVRINVLLVLNGNLKIETDYHRRFRTFRLHGEWFQLSASLRRAIWKLRHRHANIQGTAPLGEV